MHCAFNMKNCNKQQTVEQNTLPKLHFQPAVTVVQLSKIEERHIMRIMITHDNGMTRKETLLTGYGELYELDLSRTTKYQ